MLISSTVEHLKGVGYYIKPIPKSDSSSRRVYLPEYLVELLRSWKATSESEMLFPRPESGLEILRIAERTSTNIRTSL